MIGISLEYDKGQFQRLRDKLDFMERKQVLHQTTTQVAEFLRRKLQDQPPYKAVTRQQAYGVPFFSDKQRRFFFWALRTGAITVPYPRTGRLAAGWQIVTSGKEARLVNVVPYGKYVQARSTQSRMMALIGWPTVDQFVQRYQGEIGRIGIQVLKEALR